MSCCYIFISYGHQEISLLEVLKRCKKAIGWQISDLKGISPLVCTHHIYMEEEAKPIRQPQRRLNPHLQEVVRTEVLKLLQAGIIYPISDSPWVSPTQVVPKKSGITVVQNEKGEEIATRLTSGWRVLERVSGHPFYCFLDGYSGYFQIEIDVEDQEKTTFTCPFGTYAYRRMPFGLCNAPATFQRCMLSIFSDMVERIMEVFMDDITIYGGTFEECLVNLEAVLKRCIEKDLVLNWEKCHFMVHQGIVLGHIISEKGIEVDKAKVELIAKLPSPTTVKGVRQFLGHAGFYRRFIQDFSKLSRPLCELLAKDAKFVWDERCQKSFDQLKQFLTTAPIVRAPNWQLPFEVMCDASDFAIGAVLGQREDGKPYFQESGKHKTGSTSLQRFMLIIGKSPPFQVLCRSIIRKCVPEEEQQGILSHCHENACGGHFASQKTAMKVSKWVEAIPCKHNDHRVVLKFLKENIFSRFGVPKAIISDGEKDWSIKLHDSLWAYRTAYKTILDMSPYHLVYGKACHLPMEVEYNAWWAIKRLNMDLIRVEAKEELQENRKKLLRADAIPLLIPEPSQAPHASSGASYRRGSSAIISTASLHVTQKLFYHQSNPRLRRVLWNPWQRCPDMVSGHTIGGRRNMGCGRLSE
ncbi:Retrovirus-related Pol polyprotein from transposon 17.6 [Vitis vinifera]|uniref:Retrovirus-related Pol polyprotein from transposon 17.6 n=1 Tax=Vitis vinifera TaxID=29760 RepID=A0A438FVC8_VITVI|nr:Retrovirus-related Pol polyprotein from transposon 17.6 [Vitis vinifera]